MTVVIPTHNRSALVTEAVRSALAQEGVPFEVIVVDDGSTDRTREALAGFGPAIRCVLRSRGGVSAARNAGIRAARGEWLAFLDSDDLWLPGKLKAQSDFLDRNPSLLICQTGEIWLRNGRRINPRRYHAKPEGYCFPLLLDRCLISPSAVMLHRVVLEQVGLFDESLPACEDYDLWLRIGCRFPIGLVKEPLVVKRAGHGDQLSVSVKHLDRYRIQALIKLVRGGALDPIQREQALAALRKKCLIYARGCQKRGRSTEANHYLQLPDSLSPEMAAGAQLT